MLVYVYAMFEPLFRFVDNSFSNFNVNARHVRVVGQYGKREEGCGKYSRNSGYQQILSGQ